MRPGATTCPATSIHWNTSRVHSHILIKKARELMRIFKQVKTPFSLYNAEKVEIICKCG